MKKHYVKPDNEPFIFVGWFLEPHRALAILGKVLAGRTLGRAIRLGRLRAKAFGVSEDVSSHENSSCMRNSSSMTTLGLRAVRFNCLGMETSDGALLRTRGATNERIAGVFFGLNGFES